MWGKVGEFVTFVPKFGVEAKKWLIIKCFHKLINAIYR